MKSELKLTAAALAEKAAKDAKAAALSQAAALEAGAAFDKEAEARRQTFMKKWLAEFDGAALEAQQHAAMAAFDEAAQADPLMTAWLEVQRLYLRRHADGQTALSFASSVGVTAPHSYPGANFPSLSGAMQRAMEDLARRLEGARTAEIFEALDAAANGEGDV